MAKKKFSRLGAAAAGAGAGVANGLFGAGGGMVLVPALQKLTDVEEESLFPTSVAVILPLCLVSLTVYGLRGDLPWQTAWPYLVGSGLGGLAAGIFGRRIPTALLHRALGILIIWGGIRSFLENLFRSAFWWARFWASCRVWELEAALCSFFG